MDKTAELEKRIVELEKLVKSLTLNSTIPLDVERAFQARGFVETYPPDPATDEMINNAGFRTDINLSGGAETITVNSFPVRFAKYKDGTNLYIPLYALAEFF